MSTFASMEQLFTAIAGLLAALLALFQFFQYRTRRDKIRMVRESFDAVIASLGSDVEVERLAGAILLRRFFDPDTEVGVAGTPYWKEAVNVTAAILRGRETGHFQKLLADGLAFAPNLEHADLQRTNLQTSYLGSRQRRKDGTAIPTVLTRADFYRADLSGASLKGAQAQRAVFYQARLQGTVFSGADLEGANFFQADLKDARFDGARLRGASFGGALNLPPALAAQLDDEGNYRGPDEFRPPPRPVTAREVQVFISKPGCLSHRQSEQVAAIASRVTAQGMQVQWLERPEYPTSGALAEIERRMSCCAGVIVFGFAQLHVREGTWREGTREQQDVKGMSLPTPWNHVETGMAIALGLPLLVVFERDVRGGVFDLLSAEHHVHRLWLDEDLDGRTFHDAFSAWSADVRERNLRV